MVPRSFETLARCHGGRTASVGSRSVRWWIALCDEAALAPLPCMPAPGSCDGRCSSSRGSTTHRRGLNVTDRRSEGRRCFAPLATTLVPGSTSMLSVKCLLPRCKHVRPLRAGVSVGWNRAGVNEPTIAFTRTRSSASAQAGDRIRGEAITPTSPAARSLPVESNRGGDRRGAAEIGQLRAQAKTARSIARPG